MLISMHYPWSIQRTLDSPFMMFPLRPTVCSRYRPWPLSSSYTPRERKYAHTEVQALKTPKAKWRQKVKRKLKEINSSNSSSWHSKTHAFWASYTNASWWNQHNLSRTKEVVATTAHKWQCGNFTYFLQPAVHFASGAYFNSGLRQTRLHALIRCILT